MTMQQLAQVNLARLKYPLDDPRVADFVESLDRINAVADRSPGFVWRLQDDGGNSTTIDYDGDPCLIVNLSVWESPKALEKFVWQTVHKQVYARRAEWFEAMDQVYFAMWWVEQDHKPNTEEAHSRLDHFRKNGASDYAFGWEHLTEAQLWKTVRCA